MSSDSSEGEMRQPGVECVDCGVGLDPAIDTHYRLSEEERPVTQLEKANAELAFADWLRSHWVVCPEWMGQVISL